MSKKLLTKCLSVLLVAVMLVTASPLAGFIGIQLPDWANLSTKASAAGVVESGPAGESAAYTLYNDGVLVISGTGATYCFAIIDYETPIISVLIEEGITEIGNETFQYLSDLKSVTMPDSVIRIGDNAFDSCVSLELITIPDSVITIGERAFSECRSLKSVIIPSSVITIGKQAFIYCDNLTDINVEAGNLHYCSIDGVLFNSDKTELICYPRGKVQTSYNIPKGVTTICDFAFNKCDKLTSVHIPISVTTIGVSAFNDCKELTSVIIPTGVTTIEGFAFTNCTKLESLVIPNSVTSFGIYIYSGCNNLRDIYYIGTNEEWNTRVSQQFKHETESINKHFNCYLDKENEVASTCSTEGNYEEVVKSIDNDEEFLRITVTADKLPHTEVAIGEGKDPTCTETGLTEGKKCSVCDEIIEEQKEIPTVAHTEVTVEGKTPTFTETGLTEGKRCSVCGEVTVEQNIIPVIAVVDSGTCGENATWIIYENGTLVISGEGSVSEMPWVAYQSTISTLIIEDGITEICTGAFVSYERLKSVTIPNSVKTINVFAFYNCGGFDYIDVYFIGTQEEYNAIYVDSINDSLDYATKHFCYIDKQNEVASTCTSEGSYVAVYKFEDTNEEASRKTVTVDILPHTEVTVEGKEPTCTETGLTEGKKCSVCGATTVEQTEIPAKGHTEVAVVEKTPTCTEAGYTAGKKCSVCNTILEGVEPIPANGHTEEAVPGKEPTFTETGLTEGKICSVCGATIVEQEIIPVKTVVATGSCGENVTWTLYYPGNLVISGTGATDDIEGGINAPWSTYLEDITSVVIEDGITTIGFEFLTNIHNLTSITIPKSVTSIGDYAFSYNENLTSITIPKSVTTIGRNPFVCCKSLTDINVEDGNLNYIDVDGVLFNIDKTELISYPIGKEDTSYTIPNSVTSIGSDAFDNCTNLTSVIIPNSVTSIGNNAFANCAELTEVTIPNSITSIGDAAFPFCTKLKSITISNSVTALNKTTFMGCSSLESVTIPNSVKSIDILSFSGCFALVDVYFIGTEEEWNDVSIAFLNDPLNNAAKHFCTVVKENEVAATCTKSGSYEEVRYSPVDSSEVSRKTVTVDKLPHTEETVPGKEATCTETGLTEGKKCSVCDATIVAQTEIPANGHTEEAVPGKEATCTETGLTEGKKCSVCDATIVAQIEIPANGHTEEAVPGKEATCTETGLTDGKKCSVCDATIVAQTEIPANGHTEEAVPGKAPTCTETGLTEGKKCSVCDATIVAQTEIPANGHTEEAVPGKAPTCTETGLTEGKKCSVCDAIIVPQTEISALGHTEEILPGKESTYTETGLTEGKKCSVCGEILVEQEIIPVKEQLEGYRVIEFICFTRMDYYVDINGEDFEIFDHDYIVVEADKDVNFTVYLYTNFGFEDVIVYINGVVLEPNEDGSYTIPAGIDFAVVTCEPAVDEDDGGKTPFIKTFIAWIKEIIDMIKSFLEFIR